MWVYINYPNPHLTMHRDYSCRMIRMHSKHNQRVRRARISNLDQFLLEFTEQRLPFAAESTLNDIWIEIELDNSEQETGLVHVLQALLGRRYDPLADAPIEIHC